MGHKGCPIPELQEKLNIANGSSIRITGVFGSETLEEVIKFQKANGVLGQRGIVDSKTWEAVHSAVPGDHGLPTHETFTPIGWGSGGDATMLKWKQQLQPTTTDFSGCEVQEEDPLGHPRANTCCRPVDMVCMTKISGGKWTVGKNNEWFTDTVGLITQMVDKYRLGKRAPCGYTIPQRMMLIRSGGNVEYIRNVLIYVITDTEVTCMKANPRNLNLDKKNYP
jgi:Putative peptidoglycan binding domain